MRGGVPARIVSLESAAASVRCTTRRRSPCAKEVTGPSVVRSVRVSVRTNRSGYADSLMPALSSGLVPSRVASRRLRSCFTVPVLGASCATARGAAARSESAWASDRTRRVATGRHGRCSEPTPVGAALSSGRGAPYGAVGVCRRVSIAPYRAAAVSCPRRWNVAPAVVWFVARPDLALLRSGSTLTVFRSRFVRIVARGSARWRASPEGSCST